MPYTPAYTNFFNSSFFASAPYSSSLLSKTTINGGPQHDPNTWTLSNTTGTSNEVYGTTLYSKNAVARRGEIADAVSGQLSMFLNSSYTVMTGLDSSANWGSLSNSTATGYGTTLSSHTSTISSHTSTIAAHTSSISSLDVSVNNLSTTVTNLGTTVAGLTSSAVTSGGIRIKP